MPLSEAELAQRDRYELYYASIGNPVMRAIERRVCGCDYGANGWTTEAEARDIAARLDLPNRRNFLDLGAGSGWPGLYLARAFRCPTVLADLPANGLKQARQRAVEEGLADLITTVQSDAADLPFADRSFHAINHIDLLCCLNQKRAVLSECRRIVADDGLMTFTVLFVATGLSDADAARALDAGPEFIGMESGYPEMLAETDWLVRDITDVTAEMVETFQRQISADEENAASLISMLGEEAALIRLDGFRRKHDVARAGILRRAIFTVAPG